LLIAEDDDSIALFLDQALAEAGYATVVAAGRNGGSAGGVVREGSMALVLDIMLPGTSGLDTLPAGAIRRLQDPCSHG